MSCLLGTSASAAASEPGESLARREDAAGAGAAVPHQPDRSTELLIARYEAHAHHVRRIRRGSAAAFGVGGVATVGTGLVIDPQFESLQGTVIAVGGFSVVLGLFQLLPSQQDRTLRACQAEKFAGPRACPVDRSQWLTQIHLEAAAARRSRIMLSTVAMGAAVLFSAYGGVVLAVDDPNLTNSSRHELATAGFGTSALALTAGTALLLIPSASENFASQVEIEARAPRAGGPRFDLAAYPGGAGARATWELW